MVSGTGGQNLVRTAPLRYSSLERREVRIARFAVSFSSHSFSSLVIKLWCAEFTGDRRISGILRCNNQTV